MTLHKTIICACLLLLLFGCKEGNKSDNETKTISASATGIRKSDGTIEVRDSTKNEESRLDQNIKRHNEINRKFPLPWKFEDTAKLKLYKIKSVNEQGVITLEDNTTLILEGVKCNSKDLKYIAKILSSDTDRIAFIPSTDSEIIPTPAYIWHASLFLMQDPEMKGIVTSPSYSALNETVITSGWCVAEQTENNKFYERYQALEAIARNR